MAWAGIDHYGPILLCRCSSSVASKSGPRSRQQNRRDTARNSGQFPGRGGSLAKARAAITAFPRAVYVDPKRLAWPAKKASPPASKIHPAQSASSVEGGRGTAHCHRAVWRARPRARRRPGVHGPFRRSKPRKRCRDMSLSRRPCGEFLSEPQMALINKGCFDSVRLSPRFAQATTDARGL